MRGRTEFHPLAERELTEAVWYYELESRGLGGTFLDEVERGLDQIAVHPEAAPVLSGSVRRRLLRKFPYALLYKIKPNAIRILAVMNLRRRPAYWVGRE